MRQNIQPCRCLNATLSSHVYSSHRGIYVARQIQYLHTVPPCSIPHVLPLKSRRPLAILLCEVSDLFHTAVFGLLNDVLV